MMRLLLVEDNRTIASFVTKGFEQAGFAVDHTDNGEDGLHLALTEPYDVAIIDVMLPRLDGLALIDTMRRRRITTPVIILSAKRSLDDRIKGLQTGSDDYLVKPFAFSELLARVRALIRRSRDSVAPTRLTVGDLSVDLLKREVNRSGRTITLQPMEFKLLEYLMRNAETVVSKTMILEHVWDYNFDPQTSVVDVLVCRLRNKVDRDFQRTLIHTIRGVGYVLKSS
jgi:two-component system OmpR family response regulator